WFAISRRSLSGAWGAVLALAFIGALFSSDFPSLAATVFLLWLAGRPGRTKSLEGKRRITLLVGSLLLLLLLSAWPHAVLREGRIHARFIPLLLAPDHRLLVGEIPIRLAGELALVRPLDRLGSALIQLFRAQLLVLMIWAVTMPIRLHGMSLRRRFLVNYILV